MSLLTKLFDEETDLRGAFAAIASISAIGIAIGLSSPLLSFILDNRGYSGAMIGANAAVAGIASMGAVWLVTPCTNRFGVMGTLVLAALVVSASLMCFYIFESIWIWFVLRAFFHGALTLTFVLSEFWINSAASEKKRGLILGIYATMLSLGFGIGPGILAVTGSSGIAPFLIGCTIIALSSIPILVARDRQPALENTGASSSAFLKYVYLVPLATGAVFVFGAVEQSELSLFPVYGQRIGFSEYTVSLFLIAVAAGNVTLQIPLGLLSDRMKDRRIVLYICGIVGAVGMALVPLVYGNTYLLVFVLFITGGTISGLYTVGLAHLGSRLKGTELAEANTAFVFCYTLGMIFGPQLAGAMMDWYPPHGFIWSLTAFFMLYLGLCVFRAVTRRS
ncbi:MAG: MFS transporter [Salaquimonas sp.]